MRSTRRSTRASSSARRARSTTRASTLGRCSATAPTIGELRCCVCSPRSGAEPCLAALLVHGRRHRAAAHALLSPPAPICLQRRVLLLRVRHVALLLPAGSGCGCRLHQCLHRRSRDPSRHRLHRGSRRFCCQAGPPLGAPEPRRGAGGACSACACAACWTRCPGRPRGSWRQGRRAPRPRGQDGTRRRARCRRPPCSAHGRCCPAQRLGGSSGACCQGRIFPLKAAAPPVMSIADPCIPSTRAQLVCSCGRPPSLDDRTNQTL